MMMNVSRLADRLQSGDCVAGPIMFAREMRRGKGQGVVMNRKSLQSVFSGVAQNVLYDEPLFRHTTWRIGGPADVLVIPSTLTELKAVLVSAKQYELPVFVLGRGSNLLVKDGGIRGIVLKLGDDFAAVETAGCSLTVLAGRSLVSAANIAIRQGLAGLEFASLIPGTVGGAVTMNAGAHGGEIKDVLAKATVIDRAGEVREVLPQELEFAYRHSAIVEKGLVVAAATFALTVGDRAEMLERVHAWSRRRAATQPLSMPNCGSVFRNPVGDFSARLIEAAGLKGKRIGNAMISDLHANFIVNLGQAQAVDVIALMRLAQDEVWERFGVRLEPEVRVVGEDETRR